MTELLVGTDHTDLSTGRVTLRRFTRADLDKRCAWPPYDEVVFSHLNLKLKTRQQRDAWFEREWASRNPFWFAVDDENRELVGAITLRDVSRWTRTTRLGMHLHPKHLGQGYGTEVLVLFLDYYFTMLGYRMLKLDVAAYNTRAIRCYEKLGFQFKFVFWRGNLTGIEWLKDDRFADVRDCVENRRGLERVKHHEMQMDVRMYRRMQGEVSRG